MATDQECLDYARECVRLAGLINDVQTRNHMIYLAREWMATAMHADKTPEPTSREGAGANIAVGLKPPTHIPADTVDSIAFRRAAGPKNTSKNTP